MYLDVRSSPTLQLDSGAMVQEFNWIDPEAVFSKFSGQPFSLWLDSADQAHPDSRYSYIVVNPYRRLVAHSIAEALLHLQTIKQTIAQGATIWQHLPSIWRHQLPPFRGGAAGVFAYDLGQAFEQLPVAQTPYAIDDQHLPLICVGLYDSVLAFDHKIKSAYIIASGQPDQTVAARQQTARESIEQWSANLSHGITARRPPPCVAAKFVEVNYTRDSYNKNVQNIINHILDGDIFQANLSQRFCFELDDSDSIYNFYCRLRSCNSAPFAAFGHYDNWSIASASPERFLRLNNGDVSTKPIKGTAPRATNADTDAQLAAGLLLSEKDRAENTMIVDLLRNDLARVCEDNSITVRDLCVLESFSQVHHLVSHVEGRLKTGFDAVDLLRACFPGGSITGAPKIRAMEIIAQHEPTQRSFYCGSIGYISFEGSMDINIAIRTVIQQKQLFFQVGGGITAISDPDTEYQETLHKAEGILLALGWRTEQIENAIKQMANADG